MLAAPDEDTVKSKRDRAILSTLLYHALRRDELCKLKVRDFRHARRGALHLRVSGKGEKTRYLPLHPGTSELIHDYLESRGMIAEYDTGEGVLTLHHSHQVPHQIQQHFGDLFGLGAHRVRVICSDVGGGFGIKLHL